MKKLLFLFVAICLMGCKKEQPVEFVVVSVYSTLIKFSNPNEPQRNYWHIVETGGKYYVLVRSKIVTDFVENKFKEQPYPTEVYNSTFETRFEIPKYLIK